MFQDQSRKSYFREVHMIIEREETKALVLLSGGLDSAAALAHTVQEIGVHNVKAITAMYGQKHKKELYAAEDVAKYYKVPHEFFDMQRLYVNSKCSLIEGNGDIPDGTYAEQSEDGIVSTYVPFRNGLFLSVATAKILAEYPEHKDLRVVIATHQDDVIGSAYADCSSAFLLAMQGAITEGTYYRVNLFTPFIEYNKAMIVTQGLKLGVPFELTWSCYNGGNVPCGHCATCLDRAKAFEQNGVPDPLLEKLK